MEGCGGANINKRALDGEQTGLKGRDVKVAFNSELPLKACNIVAKFNRSRKGMRYTDSTKHSQQLGSAARNLVSHGSRTNPAQAYRLKIQNAVCAGNSSYS